MAKLKETVETGFKNYAATVILDRAICDARDMLKPAARMLMYSQVAITKATADKPFAKSARVVGDCLGNFYSHGDISCYETYMRMAKPFAMRYQLEDCQGNSGTIMTTADEAASRYTELRLSKLGTMLFDGIDKDTIKEWSPNFLETTYYPKVLPSKGFYNIVNGTTGIGVSLASSIPQFNIRDINNAMIKLLWDKDYKIKIYPDFATGGILLNSSEVLKSLETGTGAACALRAVVEYNKANKCFTVKELPYGVYTNTITEQIREIINNDPNCGIDYINDASGSTVNYNIYLSKDASPSRVMNILFSETSLQYYYTINMTVLKDGKKPVVLGLKDLLLEHLAHEEIIYRKEYEYDRDKIQHRIHILDGLLICLASIDEVVKTIKNSASTADASQALQKNFLLDEEQAKAVLDMKLSRLAHLEVEKIEKEKSDLMNKLNNILAILNDENLLKKEIEKGLREVALKFGDDRRTEIRDIGSMGDNEVATVPDRPLIVMTDEKNNIKAIDPNDLTLSNKGTKGSKLSKDGLVNVISTATNKTILAFDREGYVNTIDVNTIPIVKDLSEKGCAASTISDCGEIIKLASYEDKEFIIITTAGGYVKKSLLSEYKSFKKREQAIRLKEGDTIVSIDFGSDTDNVIIVTEANKVLRYKVSELKISGRITYGNKGCPTNILSSTIAADDQYLMMWDIEGKGKRIRTDEINLESKTSSGVMASEGTCGIASINGDRAFIIGTEDKGILVDINTISTKGLKASGAKIYNGSISKIIIV